MLKDLLESKNCFKLICGAGNEDLVCVENLVALYSAVGCKLFDINASSSVLDSALRGLNYSVLKENRQDYNFCISVGTKNDVHLNKIHINNNYCTKCGKCLKICPQSAINKDFSVDEKKCIGCLKCKNVCECNAIDVFSKNKTVQELFKEIDFSKYKNLTNIELHTTGEDFDEILENWKFLTDNFSGMLSFCIGRSKIGNEKVLELLKELVSMRKPYSTIIQTDGSPMSGGENDYKTTLQAVAMAEIVRNANLPVYILPSGGTNSKTAELARLCDVDINGVAVGSYARKIVKDYINCEDFLKNKEIFDKAVKIAREFVQFT